MRLLAALLISGSLLLAGVNAQNATTSYNAQDQKPSQYTPVSSPAKCSPDGYITVTQINPIYKTEYLTQWKTTTQQESQPAKTIMTCTGSVGGYGSTRTVTATTTTSLSCTGGPSGVPSYQNCIPVSHNPADTGDFLRTWFKNLCMERC
jgi:hypothetical protein